MEALLIKILEKLDKIERRLEEIEIKFDGDSDRSDPEYESDDGEGVM